MNRAQFECSRLAVGRSVTQRCNLARARLITSPSPVDPPHSTSNPYYDTVSFFPELNSNPTINHVLPSPDISLAFLSVRNLINIRDFKFLIIKIANLIKIAVVGFHRGAVSFPRQCGAVLCGELSFIRVCSICSF